MHEAVADVESNSDGAVALVPFVSSYIPSTNVRGTISAVDAKIIVADGDKVINFTTFNAGARIGRYTLPQELSLGHVEFQESQIDAVNLQDRGRPDILDIAVSASGLAANRNAYIAILTDDGRVALCSSSGDPQNYALDVRWALHDLIFRGAPLPLTILDTRSIAQNRFTALSWTDLQPAQSLGRSHAYLLVGTGAGDVLIWRVAYDVEPELVHRSTVGTTEVLHIRSDTDTTNGKIVVVTSHADGSMASFHFDGWRCPTDIVAALSQASAYRLLIPSPCRGISSRLAVCWLASGRYCVAVAFPGYVEICLADVDTASQTHFAGWSLPFYAPLTTLDFCCKDTGTLSARILGVSHLGNVWAVRVDGLAGTSEPDDMLLNVLAVQMDRKINRAKDSGDIEPDDNRIRCHVGRVWQLTHAKLELVTFFYEALPINKAMYQIAAHNKIELATFAIEHAGREVKADIAADATRQQLRGLIHDPYSTNPREIFDFAAATRAPLASIRDAICADMANAGPSPQMMQLDSSRLTDLLFGDTELNLTRLFLIDRAAADSDATAQAETLVQKRLISVLSSYACARYANQQSSIDAESQLVLLLYADFAAISGMLDQANSIYALLGLGRIAIEEDNASTPPRESCPACRANVGMQRDFTFVAPPMSGSPSGTGADEADQKQMRTQELGRKHARCDNGHVWSRCAITLRLNVGTTSRVCGSCGRRAIPRPAARGARHVATKSFVDELYEAADLCIWCCGRWY